MDIKHAKPFYIGTTAERTALGLTSEDIGVKYYDGNKISGEFHWLRVDDLGGGMVG
jgi:hypothetical protein